VRSNPFTQFEADNPSASLNDRKAAAVREAEERATERAQKIAAQSSPFSTPHQRIVLWERLHGLNLPVSPGHKLVTVIAHQTDLTVREVQEEQLRRAAELSPAGS
jgi:hypothetical protein